MNFHLAPGQQILHSHPSVSGAATPFQSVTIFGHTTPLSLVFSDTPKNDYSFQGPVAVADQNGFFTFNVRNKDGLNNNDFLVIDPYLQQLIRDFPIFWTTRAYQRDRPKPHLPPFYDSSGD